MTIWNTSNRLEMSMHFAIDHSNADSFSLYIHLYKHKSVHCYKYNKFSIKTWPHQNYIYINTPHYNQLLLIFNSLIQKYLGTVLLFNVSVIMYGQ